MTDDREGLVNSIKTILKYILYLLQKHGSTIEECGYRVPSTQPFTNRKYSVHHERQNITKKQLESYIR